MSNDKTLSTQAISLSYGGLYVNTKYGHAFGLDGIEILEEKENAVGAEIRFRNICPGAHELDLKTDRHMAGVTLDGRTWSQWEGTRANGLPVSGTHTVVVTF